MKPIFHGALYANTFSDSRKLGPLSKTMPLAVKTFVLFSEFEALLLAERQLLTAWPPNTEKEGERVRSATKCARFIHSAAIRSSLCQQGYNGIHKPTHGFLHNFDFHWTPDLFSKHVKVSRRNSHHLEAICKGKEPLRFSPLQQLKQRGRSWYALPSAFFKLKRKKKRKKKEMKCIQLKSYS